jgi:hypothetical protein
MMHEIERKIEVEIERNRIRINIFHGEDEQVIKLTLEEAEELAESLEEALEDYSKRKQIRIDLREVGSRNTLKSLKWKRKLRKRPEEIHL